MELTTSIILIIVFIVIQQIVFLLALNKIDKLARERDIYKDRLADKIECDRLKDTDVMPTSYELHTSEDYSTFIQTLQELKKENEALQKKLKAKDDWIEGNIIVKQDFTEWLKRREIYEQAKRSGVISETAVMMGEYENE